MHSRTSRFILFASLASALFLANRSGAEMGGGESRPTPFAGNVRLDDGQCELSIDVDRLALQVTAVAGKYRLVPIRIDCTGDDKLRLSAANDRLEMFVKDNGRATAVLSLRQADPAVWDAFDDDLRRTLAYPPEVAPGEPVYVFAYFPIAEVTSLPFAFEFTIASRRETIPLRNLATAARN